MSLYCFIKCTKITSLSSTLLNLLQQAFLIQWHVVFGYPVSMHVRSRNFVIMCQIWLPYFLIDIVILSSVIVENWWHITLYSAQFVSALSIFYFMIHLFKHIACYLLYLVQPPSWNIFHEIFVLLFFLGWWIFPYYHPVTKQYVQRTVGLYYDMADNLLFMLSFFFKVEIYWYLQTVFCQPCNTCNILLYGIWHLFFCGRLPWWSMFLLHKEILEGQVSLGVVVWWF